MSDGRTGKDRVAGGGGEEGSGGMPEKYRTKEGHLNLWLDEEKHGVRSFLRSLLYLHMEPYMPLAASFAPSSLSPSHQLT
jgi:hypothetical protein